MAKRIKDNRKRSKILSIGNDKETKFIHFKLINAFPKVAERLAYLKAVVEELDKPSDPILVEGRFPELEKKVA